MLNCWLRNTDIYLVITKCLDNLRNVKQNRILQKVGKNIQERKKEMSNLGRRHFIAQGIKTIVYVVDMPLPEEKNGGLWPHTGLWGGGEGTGRRSRTVQLGDLLVPSTGCNSALESQRQLCAMSPGTAGQHKEGEREIYHKNIFVSIYSYILLGINLCAACITGSISLYQIWQQSDARLWLQFWWSLNYGGLWGRPWSASCFSIQTVTSAL